MLKCGTAKEAIESLFHPGGTVDIIIRKITKNTVKITYHNQNFTVNKWGILCHETKMDNGKIWFTFCPSIYPEKEIIQAVKEYTGRYNN